MKDSFQRALQFHVEAQRPLGPTPERMAMRITQSLFRGL